MNTLIVSARKNKEGKKRLSTLLLVGMGIMYNPVKNIIKVYYNYLLKNIILVKTLPLKINKTSSI